jgi:hypothetical protein
MNLYRLVLGMIVLYFIAIIYAAYLLFYPVTPLVYNQKTLPIVSKVVQQGQPLAYTVDYCKYVNLPSSVKRTMVSAQNTVVLATAENNLPTGCHKANVYSTTVPMVTPPGVYHLEINVSYKVNALRTVQISTHTDNFTVVNSSSSASTNPPQGQLPPNVNPNNPVQIQPTPSSATDGSNSISTKSNDSGFHPEIKLPFTNIKLFSF